MSIAEPLLTPPVCRDTPVLSLERRAVPDTGGDAGNDLFTLKFRNPGWANWHPGQFVMIRPHNAARPDILWARPFSIAYAEGDTVSIVFQAVGRATRGMLGLERGELLTVWGPLGNAFAVSHAGPTLLLAGGIGIAPFVGYIKRHPEPENLRLEFGHRLPLECYPFAECVAPDCVPDEAGKNSRFQAGSHHERCPEDRARFIATLEESIRDTASRNGLVLACGPLPFLRSVQQFSLRYSAFAQLSLETRMACGIGACLGCVVKKKLPASSARPQTPDAFTYVQTCTEGPVFRADAIELDQA